LTEYQREAQKSMNMMIDIYKGGILLFDPGMGKTITSIAYMKRYREKNFDEENKLPEIIICTINLMQTWNKEIIRYYKYCEEKEDKERIIPKILLYNGNDRDVSIFKHINKYDYVITTSYYIEELVTLKKAKEHIFNNVIIDEIHTYRNLIKSAKNPNSRVYKLYNFCKNNCIYRWGLTGTLYNNRDEEIISIASLVIPKLYGGYLSGERKSNFPFDSFINDNCIKKSKKDIEMVDINYYNVKCKLNSFENGEIKNVILETKNAYDIWEQTSNNAERREAQGHILSLITKLRMSINSVFTLKDLDPSINEIDTLTKYKMSSKSQTICKLVKKICFEGLDPTNGVVIFTQFVTFIDLIHEMLIHKFSSNKDFKVYVYNGKTSTRDRETIINQFRNSNKPRVLLITFSTGGVGINLDPCSSIIIAEQWFNPAVEKQAEDRVHRLTQKNTVNIYRIITDSSIDEWVLKLKQVKIYKAHKLGLTDKNMINSNGIVSDDFKLKDLQTLFNMALNLE